MRRLLPLVVLVAGAASAQYVVNPSVTSPNFSGTVTAAGFTATGSGCFTTPAGCTVCDDGKNLVLTAVSGGSVKTSSIDAGTVCIGGRGACFSYLNSSTTQFPQNLSLENNSELDCGNVYLHAGTSITNPAIAIPANGVIALNGYGNNDVIYDVSGVLTTFGSVNVDGGLTAITMSNTSDPTHLFTSSTSSTSKEHFEHGTAILAAGTELMIQFNTGFSAKPDCTCSPNKTVALGMVDEECEATSDGGAILIKTTAAADAGFICVGPY